MSPDLHNKELSALLAIYDQEVENLKSMLLEGKPWEELQIIRRNITELAIVIHKSHDYIVHDDIGYLKEYLKEKSNSGRLLNTSEGQE